MERRLTHDDFIKTILRKENKGVRRTRLKKMIAQNSAEGKKNDGEEPRHRVIIRRLSHA